MILLTLTALAAPLLADTPVKSVDEWTYFEFSNVGSATDTYTITLPEHKEGCLIVADAFCSGDQFRVSIKGHDMGTQCRLKSWP
ncbi:hypothetical protein GGF32_002776 [Allomyces javanicus]|nr:hypothetical protein GGF32_002776 [Allomyces javanicus]